MAPAGSSSSLSSVVSSLVRAQMGTSLAPTVTDEDLDRHVAELILKEAKKKAENYAQHGVHAYTTNNTGYVLFNSLFDSFPLSFSCSVCGVVHLRCLVVLVQFICPTSGLSFQFANSIHYLNSRLPICAVLLFQ